MKKGHFISIEGIDGSGKTTQINILKHYLEDLGLDVVLAREPGGTKIGEKIRKLLLDPKNISISAETEMLLYAAARAQIVKEIILPALSEGKIVICDRYIDSSFAYQGSGRGIDLKIIENANSYAIKSAMPELTLFFDIKPAEGLDRIKIREYDRLENEKREFHEKVYEGYKIVAKKYAKRIKIIDSSKKTDDVFQDVLKEIEKILIKES